MDYEKTAQELFHEGYNCAQAVFCAFGDRTGLDREAAARLASSFGGGMGRMREVCGAVSGALLVLGCLCGYSDPGDPAAKKAHYQLVQEFARRYKEANGSIICRELLQAGGIKAEAGGDPEPRTARYYERRPCGAYVGDAARIVSALLQERACAHDL